MASLVKIQWNLTYLRIYIYQTTVFSEAIFLKCDIDKNGAVETMFTTLFACGFVFFNSHGIMMEEN